ncbi:MAG: hypothetical protein V4489_03110 [Chlamydiota bacterium]
MTNATEEKTGRIVVEFMSTEQIPSKIFTPYGTLYFSDVTPEGRLSDKLVSKVHNKFVTTAKADCLEDDSPLAISWSVTEWKGKSTPRFIHQKAPISQDHANEAFRQMLAINSPSEAET